MAMIIVLIARYTLIMKLIILKYAKDSGDINHNKGQGHIVGQGYI